MNIFEGIKKVRQLSPKKQARFDRYFAVQSRYKLLPLFADFSLFISVSSAIIFISILAQQANGFNNIHILNYVYAGIIAVLAIAHRTTKLRLTSPLIVYLMFSTMALFAYLHYISVGGGLKPLFGLQFFISSIGFLTFSLFHTLVILGVNFLLLYAATSVIAGPRDVLEMLIPLATNWFTLMCLVVAPISAVFCRWFFKNSFALQFMLNDTNKRLATTIRTLNNTENKLIQQQKHQALSHMAAGLLHEIINPVNSTTQALNYAKTINQDDEIREVLNDAIAQQSRVTTIVNDLKSFSSPKAEQNFEVKNFNLLVSQAMRLCQSILKDVKIVNALPEELSIPCYPSSTIQVLVNLFNNSASAFHTINSTQPQIELSCQQTPSSYLISIKDNGQGIKENDLKRLTDPFFSTSNAPDRLGLGLSICQTIMRHHDGKMLVSSELHSWTQVVLEFPKR